MLNWEGSKGEWGANSRLATARKGFLLRAARYFQINLLAARRNSAKKGGGQEFVSARRRNKSKRKKGRIRMQPRV